MRLDADEQLVAAMVREIASVAVDDGVAFDTELARLEPIRLDDVYGGVRVIVPARVGGARINLALDVSFGDPVTPEPVLIRFPQLLDEDMVPLLGYPIETVLAEKITTMLALGDLNTRDRDWADVWRLTGGHDLHGETVQNALVRTARHRGVGLGSLANVVAERARVRRVASCIASHQTTMKRELSAAE